MKAARARGVEFVALGEPDYPARLQMIDDPPPLIAARGKLAILTRPLVAIVGSRNASAAGVKFAERLAHAGGTIGQGEQVLAAHDVLDLAEALMIEVHDLTAGELVFLEGANDVAVIGGGEVAIPCYESGDHRHLRLNLVEGSVRAGGEFAGSHIHAERLQTERILLGRETEIGAGTRQNLGAEKVIIHGHLLL